MASGMGFISTILGLYSLFQLGVKVFLRSVSFCLEVMIIRALCPAVFLQNNWRIYPGIQLGTDPV